MINNQPFVDAVIAESVKPEYVDEIIISFYKRKIPGCPKPAALLPEHARAVIEAEDFVEVIDETWSQFLARKQDAAKREQITNNPFLPAWLSKRGTPTVFADDCNLTESGGTDEEYWTTQCIQCSPNDKAPDFNLADALNEPPVKREYIMNALADSICYHLPFFLKPVGRDEWDHKWGRSLASLAGLGRETVNKVCSCSGESTLKEVINMSPLAYAQTICKARTASGYPTSLYRLHFIRTQSYLSQKEKIPEWYGTLVLLHILKHTRYYYAGLTSYLFCAYKGRHAYIPLAEGGLSQPLGHAANKPTMHALCDILRLEISNSKEATVLERKNMEVFKYIMPEWLPKPVDMHVRSDLITPPGIVMKMVPVQDSSHVPWINSGMEVHNLAGIDVKTGAVDKDKSIVGPDTVALKWPRDFLEAPHYMNWRSSLPSVVHAELPSTLVLQHIRNLNTLGEEKGFRAMLDAIMLLDLVRDKIAGSEVGGAIFKEFPIFWILPMGSTPEETTNQGKTNLARVLSQALVPNLPVTVCSNAVGAPAQRAIASPLEQYGTAVYDEFTLPRSPDHFLNQQGIQSLSTGGRVTPGRAMENSPGAWLKHPLFIVGKYAVDIPDILNRQFSVFLDTLTDANRATDGALDSILSGKIPTLVRLAALRWIEANDFVGKVRKLGLDGNVWRFPGHGAVASMLGGGTEVPLRYMQAARKQAEKQRDDAMDGELPYQLGHNVGFNFKWYFEEAKDDTMDILYSQSHSGPIKLSEVLRVVVTNNGDRNFDAELRKSGIAEQSAAMRLTKLLKEGPLEAGKYILSLEYVKNKPHGKLVRRGDVVSFATAPTVPALGKQIEEPPKSAKAK